MAQYILESIAFQLVFLIIYDFFLKRETFFQWNRVYLIGTYALSIILPWIKIETFKTEVPVIFNGYSDFLWNLGQAPILLESEAARTISLSWQEVLFIIGAALAMFWFAVKVWRLYQLRQKGNIHYFKNFTRILVPESNIAFSFFKSIFLGERVPEKEYNSIISHELVHIKQRHTLDLLFFELMRIVNWFNPLVYVYQRRISELHEFIADAHVPKAERNAHYELLLSQTFQTQNISFVNQFFKSSLIKKRIVMLKKAKSKKIWQLKYLMLVPVMLCMLLYTSAGNASIEPNINFLDFENDSVLILEVTRQIEQEIKLQGSISNVYLTSKLPSMFSSNEEMSKREFFEYQLLHKNYLFELLTVTYPALGEDVPKEIFESYGKLPLPSSRLYEEYLENRGALKSTKKNQDLPTMPFGDVDQVPVFPGCENDDDKRGCFFESMREHIRKNFNYPKKAQEEGIQGRVGILFTINTEGVITEAKYRGPDSLLTNEAKRIITKLPVMQPGYHEGNVVSVAFSIPITFKLDSNSDDQTKEKAVTRYNQLLIERARLVQLSKESNEVIVNLDKQLKALLNSIELNTGLDKKNLNSKIYDEASDIPFSVVDEVPVFPGCENAENIKACFNNKMQNHISKNFKYPKEAEKKGIEGQVNLMFKIADNGMVKDIRYKGAEEILNEEGERIIKKLPKMKPGNHKGRPVNVIYSIPISFKLN